MNKLLTLTTLCALIFTGCATYDDPTPGAANVMAFAPREETRATSPLHDHYDNFAVYTWMNTDGEKNVVMQRDDAKPYVVTYNDADGNWTYDASAGQELKYWDFAADSYEFVAVAPNAEGQIALDEDDHIIVSNITGNVSHDEAPDWYRAALLRQGNFDAQPQYYDYDIIVDPNHTTTVSSNSSDLSRLVNLTFHPLMSIVRFTLKNSGEETTAVTGVTVTLNKKNGDGTYSERQIVTGADCDATTGVWTLGDPSSATLLDSGAATISGEPTLLLEAVQIPQTLTEGSDTSAYVTITVTTSKENFTIVSDAFSTIWEAGKIYTYNLSVSISDSIILLDVLVDDWEKGEGSPIDGGTQTNW